MARLPPGSTLTAKIFPYTTCFRYLHLRVLLRPHAGPVRIARSVRHRRPQVLHQLRHCLSIPVHRLTPLRAAASAEPIPDERTSPCPRLAISPAPMPTTSNCRSPTSPQIGSATCRERVCQYG